MIDHKARVVGKYQISTFSKVLAIVYLVVAILTVLTVVSGGGSEFNGGTTIVLFVIGLNCFKSSFLFAQANNVTRRSFFIGTLLALVFSAFAASLIDTVLASLLRGRVSYGILFERIYPQNLGARLPWQFALLTLAASSGWLITMIYYRSNTLMKYFVSFSPLLMIWIINLVAKATNGELWAVLDKFGAWALGFSTGIPNPYPPIITFSVASLLIWLVNAALMYKMPVKTR